MPKKTQEPVTVPAPDMFATETLPAIRMESLKTKRRLTLDVVSISKLGELVMMCQGELQVSSLPSKFAKDGKAEAYLIDVFDVVRSIEYTLVCNAVLASSLKRAGEPLQGRYFAVRVGEVEAGKRYRKTDVVELERVD